MENVEFMGIPLPTAAGVSTIFQAPVLPQPSFPCSISFSLIFVKNKVECVESGGGVAEGACVKVVAQKRIHTLEKFCQLLPVDL